MAVPSHPLRRLNAEFLRPYHRTLAFALAGMLLQTLLALPLPIVQGRVLDRLVAGGAAAGDLTGLLQTAVVVTFGCLVCRAFVAWRVGVVMTRVSLEVVRELTDALHRKLQRLPLSYLDRHQSGGLMARLTSDVGTLMIFLNTGTLQLVTDLALAAGIAGVLAWLNWPLALIALAAVPLAAAGQVGFAGLQRRRSLAARGTFTDLYALLAERVPAIRVIRAFGQEPAEADRLAARLNAHAETSRSWLRAAAWQAAVAALIGGVGIAAVVVVGAALVAAGRLTAGELLSFYALTALFYAPIVRLAQFQAGAAATRVAMERIVELLDEPTPPEGDGRAARPAVRGSVGVRQLTFGYRPNDPPVLRDVSFRVRPGGSVGIVGPSGSGKSTLLSVIANLYPPARGAVEIDGADPADWRPEEFRRGVVLVPQRPTLFEGTIRSNLTYAAPGASDFRLWQLLEAVDLGNVVRARPGGLDAVLGPGGVGLSGGQRQRLALARALLVAPAVLLLDDCTSALDTETEARVRANVAALLPGTTRVIVSHKPAAVRGCDEILVLVSGGVVARGSYDELLARDESFAALVRSTRSTDGGPIPVSTSPGRR